VNVAFLVARKQIKLSQVALASMVQISQADVSRIEKGGWIPPAELRDRLARALSVPAAALFGHESNHTAGDPAVQGGFQLEGSAK
jgi:transcriptional regulator with XRE-family HTH domain